MTIRHDKTDIKEWIARICTRFRLNIQRLHNIMANRNRRARSLSASIPLGQNLWNNWAIMLFMISMSMIFIDEIAYHCMSMLSFTHRDIFNSITDIMAASKLDLFAPIVFCLLILVVTDPHRMVRRMRMLFAIAFSYAAFFSVVFMLSAGLVYLIKILVGRSRPSLYEKVGVTDFHFFLADYLQSDLSFNIVNIPFSFPSGHATIIAVKATVLSLIFPKWRWLIIFIAFWIAISRVVVGAHYLSDVVAGVWLGVAITLICARWMARRRLGFTMSERGDIVPLAGGCYTWSIWELCSRLYNLCPSRTGKK